MWLLTTIGFYSITQNARVPGEMMIRARMEEDIENLRKVIPSLSETMFTTHSDYAYRAFCSQEELSKGLATLGEMIDYTGDFKGNVSKRQGKERGSIYLSVWNALHKLRMLDPRTRKAAYNKTFTVRSDEFPRKSRYTSNGRGEVKPK
jgi:hypothetical protein